MAKYFALCFVAFLISAEAARGVAPIAPRAVAGVEVTLSVLSAVAAQLNVRSTGPGTISLDTRTATFQLRSRDTGIVYFMGATVGAQRRISWPDGKLTAVAAPVELRLPRVADGIYDLEVDVAASSPRAAASRFALDEPIYIHNAYVTPIRRHSMFFRMPDEWSPHVAEEYALEGFVKDSAGLPTNFKFKPQPQDLQSNSGRNPLLSAGVDNAYERLVPEIDDPVAQRLTQSYSRKPLWTFGPFKYTCFGDIEMGAKVTTDKRRPMYIDRVIRVSQSPLQRQLGAVDPSYGCSQGCQPGWHVATDHPIVAMFRDLQATLSWLRLGVASRASPYPGACERGVSTFVDDWDFERTFTAEDPRTIHPEWDPALRSAMLDFNVRVGMTHEMVAFAIGYPSMQGTRSQLDRLRRWTWYPGTACSGAATFVDDKLVRFEGKSECEMPIVIGRSGSFVGGRGLIDGEL